MIKLLPGLLFGLLVLTGCSTTAMHLNPKAITTIPADHGIVIIGLQGDVHYERVTVNGTQKTELPVQTDRDKQPYFVFNLPKGRYALDTVWLNSSRYLTLDQKEGVQKWDFAVTPGEITYIGNLVINDSGYFRYYVRTNNYSVSALEYLEKEYPDILKTHKLIYSGSEKDVFFDYVGKQKGFKND